MRGRAKSGRRPRSSKRVERKAKEDVPVQEPAFFSSRWLEHEQGRSCRPCSRGKQERACRYGACFPLGRRLRYRQRAEGERCRARRKPLDWEEKQRRKKGRATWTGFRAPANGWRGKASPCTGTPAYRHCGRARNREENKGERQQVAFSVRESPGHLALSFIFFSVSLTRLLERGRRPDFALPLTPLLCFSQSSGFLSALPPTCGVVISHA